MAPFSICLCFSDTGGGHRSAAEAVEAALLEVAASEMPGEQVKIHLDNLAEKSHPINRLFVDLYNYLLRHHQEWMKYYAWFIEATKPNDSKIGYWLAKKFTREVLARDNPSVVVSVHPMVNHYLARVMREMGIADRVKLITVLTDPNYQLWTGWACKDVDIVVSPNDLASKRLIELGIDGRKIRTIGMPIQPQFLRPPKVSRKEFLGSLGLDPAHLTVCINAGWAGGGNMLEVYRALSSVCTNKQVIVVCGHNQELLTAIETEKANSLVNTVVLPYLESMSDLMASCDLMVTKAGGLTTFEAIARRLPMAIDLLTEPMPQEAGTAQMLFAQGLAQPLYKPSDIVSIVESLQLDLDRASKPLPSAHNLDKVDAVFDIARIILQACEPKVEIEAVPSFEASPGMVPGAAVSVSPQFQWDFSASDPRRLEIIPEAD